MADFSDDIMRAAREAYITGWGPQMDWASAERIRLGVLDDTMIMVIVAAGIAAERKRCLDVAFEVATAELAVSSRGSISRAIGAFNVRSAIQGPTT